MRNRLISTYIAVILASCICGCAQTAENAPVAEMENEEQEDTSTEAEDEDETDAADEISESEEQASPVYVIYPQLTQDDAYEMQDWQAAYAEYIEGLEWNRDCTYSLIYVDDDDIPELVIDSGFEAGGCEILTYHSGEIDALQTDRRLFYYIEKKNLLNNTGGAYGYYYDRIYTIENGKWVCIADGEQTEITGEDWVFRYEWDGAEVEEDVYEQNLNAIFDREQGIEPDLYYIMDEMLSLFRTGDVASQNHRYELFVEDITWEQAGYNVVDLHFIFDDTVIDREIVAYDVRDIVYKDITGDGIDEALIYCDFANNTCDWQLIYFYQIEQGNVTDISPSSDDIPELNNADWGIWNTWWVAAETMEGYSSPIYKLEDYYKENGIVYVQETLYIGYRDGKWELVQGFD